MKHGVNRSSLFLTELIFSLCIFLVCAIVCVSLLLKAHGISRDSTELTDAVYIAQSVAEHPSADLSAAQQAGYAVEITPWIGENGAQGETITVSKDGRIVYTLKTGG